MRKGNFYIASLKPSMYIFHTRKNKLTKFCLSSIVYKIYSMIISVKTYEDYIGRNISRKPFLPTTSPYVHSEFLSRLLLVSRVKK